MSTIPAFFVGTLYSDFLAELCRQRAPRVYLEIGVQSGQNLAGIEVDTAIGIDPGFILSVDPTVGKRVLTLHRTTSDAFFAREADEDAARRTASRVDLAFLDGMHLFEFLLRDFYNVEAASSRNGLITMHDCMPLDDRMIARTDVGIWTGDVWKVVMILERYRPDLRVVCVDCMPTGLVCVSNLDPTSTVLRDRYCEIVDEFAAMPNDRQALEAYYRDRRIVSATDITSDNCQSLYFRS